MSKIIRCAGCNVYLGEIRDALLNKGMVFLCPKCDAGRIAANLLLKDHKEKSKVSNSLFGDVFGDLFK